MQKKNSNNNYDAVENKKQKSEKNKQASKQKQNKQSVNTKKSAAKEKTRKKQEPKSRKSNRAESKPVEQSSRHGRYSKIMPPVSAQPVKISFLGGINEIGKNMTCYEYGKSMLIVDCGLAFPETDQLGVDFVIPDFSHIERNIDKVKGVVITHGHEDHIGALCYFLEKFDVPVYATLLTIGLINAKLEEHNIGHKVNFNVIKAGDRIGLGDFSVEFIRVNHSIPDAVAVAITTESGTIIQTGDFKIDTTPVDGGMIDLSRFAEYGKNGVLCMLSDSTNAEQPGFTQSESKVGETFKSLFARAGKRRIIIATFASNVHRVQQIINIAHEQGRKVALSGRSLEKVVEIGSELGYMKIPKGTLISIDEIKNFTDDKLVLITTGSQGEPMSALARMASNSHRKVFIGSNDCIIISARPIPGNEKTVGKVVDDLLRLGAEVIYEKMYDVHVSGHACQEELKLMLSLVSPK